MAMPTTIERTRVRLICGRCRHAWELCVPVSVAVPGPIRCSPGGGPAAGSGTPTGLRCPACNGPCKISDKQLQDLVTEELRRQRGRHVAAGAVFIDLR